MIVIIHKAGTSFKGLATYLTHDVKAETDERVSWTRTLNLAHDHVGSAVDEMLWTARSAELLKQEAGLRAGGRETENAIKHVSLNWSPEDKPTAEHMAQTTEAFLRQMNWHEHQAIAVAHQDKDHAHVHLMINTVHPETGLHLDDGFDKRRAQKWALAYEQETGRIHCEQRLENISDREEAPTRPAWTAFKGKEREFEQQERVLAGQMREPVNENEKSETENGAEWKKLKQFQREERTGFFAEGKLEFSNLRRAINSEVRAEFKDRWADYYLSERSGTDADLLASTKTELVAEQKAELEKRRDRGCELLRESRDERYRELLDYQMDTRHGLRGRQEAGFDNTFFLEQVADGTLRDRWPAFRAPVLVENMLDEMKREAAGITGERAEEASERSEAPAHAPSGYAIGPSFTSGIAKGADAVADIGLALIFLFDSAASVSPTANSNAQAHQAQPPARDPFEGVREDAAKREQSEKEGADAEWRKKQRSYGD
jgi:hypothetical protein